jgi:mercuric reductase
MNKIKTIKLNIKGMTCDGCATGIEKSVNTLNGIYKNEVSYPKGEGEFSIDESLTSKDDLVNEIEKSGTYKVEGEIKSGDNHFDIIIVGGGSAAFSAAIKANDIHKKTLIVNTGLPMGGTCVNVGCVPSKYLIRAAESIHNSSHSNFRSVKTTKATFNFKDIIQEKRDLVDSLRQQKYLDIASDLEFVTLLTGYAKFKNSNTVIVDENTEYTADKFLIATGSTSAIPPIKGLENIDYLTNRSLFELEELPNSLIVLGGGYIALEIAQMMNRLGAKVTLVQRSEHVLSNQVEDIGTEIQDHLRNEGIEIITGTKIELIEKEGENVSIDLFVGRKPKIVKAEKLVVATGITPNTTGFGLDSIEVKLTSNNHVNTNAYLQTNHLHIFAAGDCIDTPAFVYTAAYEGNLAIKNMFDENLKEKNYTGMPWVVFTDPQVAGVGIDEAEAEKEGIDVEVSKLPLNLVPRSLAALDTRGFVKLIRDKESDKLIGARIVAPEGSELTMELSLAIKYGIPTKELASAMHAYLTLSEAVKLAAIGFGKDVYKLSCCAS